jgi:cell shape-determining protein MreC
MEHGMKVLFTAIGLTIGIFLQRFEEAAASWYWFSLLSKVMCLAFVTAAFTTFLRYMHLIFIAPKKELTSRAQRLIDTADERARNVNLRTNILEKKTSSMKKELAQLYAERRRFRKVDTPKKCDIHDPPEPAIAKTKIQIEQDY